MRLFRRLVKLPGRLLHRRYNGWRIEMWGIDKDKLKAAFRRFRENLPLAGKDLAKRLDLVIQLILDLEQAFS